MPDGRQLQSGGKLLLVFSAIDRRVASNPNPAVPADAAFIARHFPEAETADFFGSGLWLGEVRLTLYSVPRPLAGPAAEGPS